jgi:hypothetical protein
MKAHLLKFFAVYFTSMFKFVFGPVTGIFSGLTVVETAIAAVLGMMTSVVVFTFGGVALRDWWFSTFKNDRKLFSPKNRRMVKFWLKYGIKGVAFFTPVFFSPIVGTLLAVSFGENKIQIFKFMFISALFWAVTISFTLKTAGSFFK